MVSGHLGLLGNKYITAYGRKKVLIVTDGVERIQSGDASLKDVMAGSDGMTFTRRPAMSTGRLGAATWEA